MKKLLLALIATIALTGCAGQMLRNDLTQQHLEYWTPLLSNPDLDVLDGKIWFGTPGVFSEERPLHFYENNKYPTEPEKKALRITYGYTKGWMDIFKNTVSRYSRAYNDIVNAGFSAVENNKIELIMGKVTYGEYALRAKTISDKWDESVAVRDKQLMTQQAAAFSTFLYNQQLINAVNQPRTIAPFSCRKVGHTYHCF
jgi:hypothetical protein